MTTRKYFTEIEEFVNELLDTCMDPVEPTTTEDAAKTLSFLRDEGWSVPDGITAEELAETWNEMREYWIRRCAELDANRLYKEGWRATDAADDIAEQVGTRFGDDLIKATIKVLAEIEAAKREENNKDLRWWAVEVRDVETWENLLDFAPDADAEAVKVEALSRFRRMSKHDQDRINAYYITLAPRWWEDGDIDSPYDTPDLDKAEQTIELLEEAKNEE